MKIGQNRSRRRGALVWIWFVTLLVALAIVIVMGERGLYQVLDSYWLNMISSIGAATENDVLPSLIVDMGFNEYDNILAQRQEALQSGVFIATESDFNPATIRLDDREIPVRMRLAQGPAIHLGEDDKWNLDVRTRDDQLLLGMRRFHLIDPADNNWLNEWAFQQNLALDGILSTNYQFVHLFFNGNDQGIYVVQEGMGLELPQAQGRPEGVMVEFDATRLWESIAHFGGNAANAANDPVTNLTASDFQYFEVDTFQDASIADDALLSDQKDRAISLLRGLQNGELTAAEVFDVQQYGRFLALVDLWGATDAASLVNLRYYYNPESGRLEPIGFSGNPLRFQSHEGGRLSLDATYNDPDLQTAYSQSAHRLSQSDYLEQLQIEMDDELRQLQRALKTEATLPLPWEPLRDRQLQIQRSLNPLQPVFAYLGSPNLAMSATIQIDVANVLNVPVEILGFDIDGATFLEVNADWIQNDPADLLIHDDEGVMLRASDNNDTSVLRYVRFHIPLTQIIKVDRELDTIREPEIQIATRILGQDRRMLTPVRPGYPDQLLNPIP